MKESGYRYNLKQVLVILSLGALNNNKMSLLILVYFQHKIYDTVNNNLVLLLLIGLTIDFVVCK